MKNHERSSVLKRCKTCPHELVTDDSHCPICGGLLITVVVSSHSGRITPMYDEEHMQRAPHHLDLLRDQLNGVAVKEVPSFVVDDDCPF